MTTKYYAVVGRIPGDDEDSCKVFAARDEEDAVNQFSDWIYETSGSDRADIIASWGEDLFIDYVLSSDSEIVAVANSRPV